MIPKDAYPAWSRYRLGNQRARAAYTADAQPGEPSYIPPPLPPRICRKCGQPAMDPTAKVGLMCAPCAAKDSAARSRKSRARKDKK